MIEGAGPDVGPDQRIEGVRQRIGSLIIQNLGPVKMPLPVITLDGDLEAMLAQAMRVSSGANHPIEPALGNRIVEAVLQSARPIMGQARSFAIVTSPVRRRVIARLFQPHLPETPVLSFLDIPAHHPVEVL